jgi:Leucine-rich repeat (LRR) protein
MKIRILLAIITIVGSTHCAQAPVTGALPSATPSIPTTAEDKLLLTPIQAPHKSVLTKIQSNFDDLKNRIKQDVWLDLSNYDLESFEGLESVPGIQNIESLSLHGNAIKKINSYSFAGMPKLQTLALNNNGLTSEVIAPNAFARLNNLKLLYLNDNPLQSISRIQLAGLTNLRTINLHKAGLKSINKDTFELTPNVELINLNDNQLTDFDPAIIASLSKLRGLNLKNNPIDRKKIEALRAQFPHIKVIF